MSADHLFQLRRALHQNPEIAAEESATAKRILNFFDPLKPHQTILNLGGHGLAFVLKIYVKVASINPIRPIRKIRPFFFQTVGLSTARGFFSGLHRWTYD